MKKINALIFFILPIILMISFISFNVNAATNEQANKIEYRILVDLNDSKLFLIKNKTGKIVKVYPIASGKPKTPSPIGTWKIVDKAVWGKGFGTRWMALNVPWGKYGIHGTNKPLTIGGAYSLGCIRMLNKDVENLYDLVNIGTLVVIYGGPYDLNYNTFRLLLPGDRGSDVLEFQRRLKNAGYYKGTLNGIYDDELKKDVIRFKLDCNLPVTHDIDKTLCNTLGIFPFE